LRQAWQALEPEARIAFLTLTLTAQERQMLRDWLANEAVEEDRVWPCP